MQQTEEHLQILTYLGVERAVVASQKAISAGSIRPRGKFAIVCSTVPSQMRKSSDLDSQR
jgi:selenocysteine-specific translation elongation factor